MEYIIAKDTGRQELVHYFSVDTFWLTRSFATQFTSRDAAERHVEVLVRCGEKAELLHVLPA